MLEMKCVASGPAPANIAIANSGGSPFMRNVHAEATGGDENIGVLNVQAESTMRFMTVVASGGRSAVGVYNDEAIADLVNVGVTATATSDSTGIRSLGGTLIKVADSSIVVKGGEETQGIHSASSSTIRIKNVHVEALNGTVSNHGIFTDSADNFLNEVTIVAKGDGDNTGVGCQDASTVRINHSSITADDNTISATGKGFDVKVGATWLNGGPAVGCTCAGVYNGGYTFYPNTCPP